MNLRTIKTDRLIDLWMDRSSEFHVSNNVWDELYRRCKGNPIKAEDGGTGYYLLNLNSGWKGIWYEIPRNAKDLDREFLETSPQATDSLAFEPSDELDAATLAQ
jgi:hypothetical protein